MMPARRLIKSAAIPTIGRIDLPPNYFHLDAAALTNASLNQTLRIAPVSDNGAGSPSCKIPIGGSVRWARASNGPSEPHRQGAL